MRIRKAEEFLRQADRALTGSPSPDSAAALAVLSAIAASDAACCSQLGVRSRAQDHRQARHLLATVRPDGERMARLLDELISAKDVSHYGMSLVEHERAARLVRRASQLLHLARAVTKGRSGF